MPGVDSFGSFARGPDGPYTHAVALTPALGEVAPTAAIFVNAPGLLTVKLADDSAAVGLYVRPGLMKLRVKQVISLTIGANPGDAFDSPVVPPVIGLY